MNFRSEKTLKGIENQYYRATMKSMGYTTEELKQPIIAIANSWTEGVPGHYNLKDVARRVRDGINRNGGTVVEFGTIACCDGMAQGHEGMHYILPARQIISDSIETFANAQLVDAIVLLGSCDKIVPAMLMAAARLDIPCILLPGGPMEGGSVFDGRKSDQTSSAEAYGMLSAGKITESEYTVLEEQSCPSCGSCSYLGTANTMCILSEAMGMTLPDGAMTPATSADRLRLAELTGRKIVELAKDNITARKIITNKSIRNAIKVCLAISGSTNAVMHLTAIAKEAELDINVLEEFEKLSRHTPQIAKLNPASKWNVVDFHYSGGVPKVMENLKEILETDVKSVTGYTVEKNLQQHIFRYANNFNIIKTKEEPFGYEGGVAVLRGNLAPNTGITKPGAFDRSLDYFVGKAICFDCEEEAEEAILKGKVKAGHIVVIRYEGPKGGPGMREMFKAMKYLYGRGLATSTALITDGRFSGTNNGCFVGHISPEAAEGGPIAIVEDGDEIEIDINNRSLNLIVSQEEINRRLSKWKRPKRKFTKGYLGLYSKFASSGAEGGILKFDEED